MKNRRCGGEIEREREREYISVDVQLVLLSNFSPMPRIRATFRVQRGKRVNKNFPLIYLVEEIIWRKGDAFHAWLILLILLFAQ